MPWPGAWSRIAEGAPALRNQVSANAHEKLGVIPRWEHDATVHTDRHRCDECNQGRVVSVVREHNPNRQEQFPQ